MRSLLVKITALLALIVSLSGVFAGSGAQAAGERTLASRTGFAGTSSMLLWGPEADLYRDLDAMAASGARWIRFDFDWSATESVQGTYDWTAIDRVVKGARARNLQILGLVTYTPEWARPAGTSEKTPPIDPANFAKFSADAVRRYAPMGVKHWEIWNEPNIVQFWQPKPDPAGYASLLRAAFTAMRAVDSEAFVLTGGTSPAGDSEDGNYVNPTTFLTKIYEAGGKHTFSAVGHHPYNFPDGPLFDHPMNAFSGMTPVLHDIMVANGEGHKKIWATEYGAPTGTWSTAVSEERQSSILTEGLDQWAKWSYTGPFFWYAHRDRGTDLNSIEDNFGMVRNDFSHKPVLAELTRMNQLEDPLG